MGWRSDRERERSQQTGGTDREQGPRRSIPQRTLSPDADRWEEGAWGAPGAGLIFFWDWEAGTSSQGWHRNRKGTCNSHAEKTGGWLELYWAVASWYPNYLGTKQRR